MRLGHVHLKVRDLARAVAFYGELFELRLVEQVGEHYAFLSGSESHHELALQRVGPHAPAPHPAAVGLYHVAFEVPDQASLARAWATLRAQGIDPSAVDHGISWALYFSDPDGNGLEIYWDRRAAADGATAWQGASRPLPVALLQAALA